MKTIAFRLKGTKPMMLSAENPFENGNGKTAPEQKALSAHDQAEHHLHKAKVDGRLSIVMPSINLQKSVRSAYSYMPGRKGGWKKFVKALTIETPFMPIEPQDWTLDARRAGGKFGGTGGTMLYRPRFDEWNISGEMRYDQKFLSEEQCRQLFDYAGAYVGLGAWRLGNEGPYGGFIVTEWREINS